MKYFELKINVELKHKFHHTTSLEVISKFLATYFMNKGDTSHLENKFKYVFSNFNNPKDKYYSGKTSFVFRSFNEKYVDMLIKSIGYKDKFLRVNEISLKEVKFKRIKRVVTLNPTFITTQNNRFWTYRDNGDIRFFIERLTKNLVKKYKYFFGKDIYEDWFFEFFQFKNEKPLKVRYQLKLKKGGKNVVKEFFGNKIYGKVKDDENSQKLAFVAMGAGLGEKNALLGGGFLKEIKSSSFRENQ